MYAHLLISYLCVAKQYSTCGRQIAAFQKPGALFCPKVAYDPSPAPHGWRRQHVAQGGSPWQLRHGNVGSQGRCFGRGQHMLVDVHLGRRDERNMGNLGEMRNATVGKYMLKLRMMVMMVDKYGKYDLY